MREKHNSIMAFCTASTCKCRTRFEYGWHQTPGFNGRVHGYGCSNCGRIPIARDMLVSEPDKESRWATKDELTAMRKAQIS